MIIKFLLLKAGLLLHFTSFACNNFNDSLLTGTWKGASICQVKNSPCNDEVAIYHISKTDRPNIFRFKMGKMVNEKEIIMGTLDFNYNENEKIFSSTDNERHAIWTLNVNNETIEGLLVYKGTIFRKILLHKSH